MNRMVRYTINISEESNHLQYRCAKGEYSELREDIKKGLTNTKIKYQMFDLCFECLCIMVNALHVNIKKRYLYLEAVNHNLAKIKGYIKHFAYLFIYFLQ